MHECCGEGSVHTLETQLGDISNVKALHVHAVRVAWRF
jgi:hypothetical protein